MTSKAILIIFLNEAYEVDGSPSQAGEKGREHVREDRPGQSADLVASMNMHGRLGLAVVAKSSRAGKGTAQNGATRFLGGNMTLGELRPGCRCCVRRLRARGILCRRLMDLGFYPGVHIKVLRNAPLRDPVELEIDGYFLSIRRSEAHEVEVESHEA